ncbi:hypothetical protein Btru_023870 [Bulinus truncatus]|nr:hypothetical protein Btru_023870 [Bulinus truncatus]
MKFKIQNNISDSNDDSRQSFRRGDSTRKALHRRVPSAPNTPRQERRHTKERSSSMTRGENSSSEDMDISLEDFIYPKRESQGDINIDAAIKSRLQQVADQTRFAKSSEELTLSPLKRSARTPPVGRKKAKGEEESSPTHLSHSPSFSRSNNLTKSLNSMPARTDSSPYDNNDRESRMRHFYSRFHDYAEILSDDDQCVASTPDSQGTMSVSSSGCNMQEVLDQIDTRLAMNAMLFPRPGIGDTSNYRVGDDSSFSRETVFSSGGETTTTITGTNHSQKETEFSVNQPSPHASLKHTEFPASVNALPREHTSPASVKQLLGLNDSTQSLEKTQGDKSGAVTVVGRRKMDVKKGDTGKNASTIYHRGGIEKGSAGVSTTRVVRRRAEFIPSSSATSKDMENLQDLLNSLENEGIPSNPSSKHSSPKSHEHNRSPLQLSHQSSNSGSFESDASAPDLKGIIRAGMSKCLSVPSDIARSLENVTESQTDMLSSVTISELSMSVNSFTNGQDGVTPTNGAALRVEESDPRRRRSTSLDSLTENDHLMTRTLREINRQMDVAFKHDSGSHRMISSDLELSTSPDIKVTPQALADLRSAAIVRVNSELQGEPLKPKTANSSSTMSSSSHIQKKSSLAISKNSKSYSQSDDSEDSLTFVTDVASCNSLANIPLLSPTLESRDITSSENSASETIKQTHWDSSSYQRESESGIEHTVQETFEHRYVLTEESIAEYKQTHRQHDDHITLETQVIQPRLRRQEHAQPSTSGHYTGALTDSQHHFSEVSPDLDRLKERSTIANMCRNRSTSSSSSTSSVSSKSSEEFDEVASPDEDVTGEVGMPTFLHMEGGKSPISLADRRQLGNLSVDLPTGDLSLHHVIRRQHSPRVDQRSPLTSPRLEPELSPRVKQQPDLPELSDNLSWQSNVLFSAGAQMDESETSERMSSLCAAGFMSQRARLSRESSNSSLQSPDSSHPNVQFGNIRNTASTPLREALPDLVQSTTTPPADDAAAGGGDVATRSNVPLQLALYHPDEFSMDIPASISAPVPFPVTIHPSPSLPQVHTSMDVIMENKVTLKKSNTDNCISDQASYPYDLFRSSSGDADHSLGSSLRSTSFEGNLLPGKQGSSIQLNQEEAILMHRHHYPVENLSFSRGLRNQEEGRRQPVDFDHSPSRNVWNTERAHPASEDEVAMEVDNLCNKLVDDLKSPRSDSSRTHSPIEDSLTVLASRDIRTDVDEQGSVSMEVETSLEVSGSEPATPVIRERRLIRSSSMDGEKVETSILSMESSHGDLDQEEVQNVLNQGREILMSPENKDGLDRTFDSLTPTSESSIAGRKTSFSKIPRPKASPDVVHKFSSSNQSYRSSFSGSMSASMHADISPSSSSTSSSSSSKAGHARRGSEASPMASSKRGGHTRRSSDTKISDFRTVSPTSRIQTATGNSAKPSTNQRGSDVKTTPENKSSRIPLSHRVPSPQSEASSLGVNKPQSKIPSPIPKPRKMSNSFRSQQGALPADDTIEVTRQSVKRESSGKSEKDSSKKEPGPTAKRTVTVKDVPDKGAKLVIETQQDLKKKIQTVHAKKVSQPSRQVAEALESDSNYDQLSKVESVSPASGVSRQLTSDIKTESLEKRTPPPVAKRKFHYDSKSLPRRSTFLESHVSFSQQVTGASQYSDMAGSRSSLDDSFLQLAAERHDLFIPEDPEEQRLYALCTGSLRVKRSQKMQSLMDLFERGSDSNVSDSSGSPGTRHRDRTYSGSLIGHAGHLTPCLEGSKFEQDTGDDEAFHPDLQPNNSSHLSEDPHRSRTRERVLPAPDIDTCNVGRIDKENCVASGRAPKKSPTGSAAQQPAASLPKERQQGSADLRQRPSSPSRKPNKGSADKVRSPVSSSSEPASSNSPSLAAKNSRPPKYRSNSKSRTYSESSTSESDTTHHGEGSTVRFASSHATSMSSSFTSSLGNDLFSSQGQQLSASQSSVIRRRADTKRDSKAKEGKHLLSSQGISTPPPSPSAYTPPTSPRNNERRNSIKELRQVFERCESETVSLSSDPEHPIPATTSTSSSLPPSSPSTHQAPTARARIRSTSPQSDEHRHERIIYLNISCKFAIVSGIICRNLKKNLALK